MDEDKCEHKEFDVCNVTGFSYCKNCSRWHYRIIGYTSENALDWVKNNYEFHVLDKNNNLKMINKI